MYQIILNFLLITFAKLLKIRLLLVCLFSAAIIRRRLSLNRFHLTILIITRKHTSI